MPELLHLEGPPPGDPAEADILFVGTATLVIRLGGFTVLTDPNFLHQGDHAKLGYGLRSRRRTEPALGIDDLPPIDLVVLSHHHGDHFDEVAAAGLDPDLPILTTEHAAAKLRRQGFRRPVALEPWASQIVARGTHRLRVTALPGKHAPQPLGSLLPPVMGSMLEYATGAGTAFRLYLSGDTLMHDRLAEIPRRYPDIDLGVFHLGGTRILGVLLTMDAAQGVEALRLLHPREALPVHYDDYGVFKSPLSDFTDALKTAEDIDTVVHVLDRGEHLRFRVPALGAPPSD
jgi:L-ascorbate metabolism protein UlaG (beta-lactamase superfamily)